MRELNKSPVLSLHIKRNALAMLAVWTTVLAVTFSLHVNDNITHMHASANIMAEQAIEKDIIYRLWATGHGGVYVLVTEDTPPSPYLSHIPERDIETSSGRKLTLLNPAYMTRQVNEMEETRDEILGHITSLDPIRPENAPDAWEAEALRAFEGGAEKVLSYETMQGEPYLRLMQPMITEAGCLKCHAQQGYKVGDIRGGISVSVAMAPLLAIERKRTTARAWAYGMIWLLGVGGIGVGTVSLLKRVREREQAKAESERLIVELRNALEQVKTLRGIVPICAHCKKIRDDKGYWNQVEVYVHEHSEAEFSHSICPDCIREVYPELADSILGDGGDGKATSEEPHVE